MGKMKKFLMDVSEEMGFHGEINQEVIDLAQDKLAYMLELSEEKEKLLNEKENLLKEKEELLKIPQI